MNPQTQPQVDPTALALSRSIRAAEGGDYNNTSGDNGTSAGAYQFNNGKITLKKGEIPANFKSWATEQGLDPNDFSQTNQDHVAYNRIKQKLDAKQAPSSIAAEWNSGLSKGWENHRGDVTINGKVIHYDTPAYVTKVQKFYQDQLNGKGVPETPSSTSTPSATTASESKSSYTTSQHSPERLAQYKAEAETTDKQSKDANSFSSILGNTITGIGDNLSFGGASQLGEQLGTGFAKTTNQVRGLLGGTDNSKYMEDMSFGKTTAGLAKTVGGILATAAPGLKGIMAGPSILGSAEVLNGVKNGAGISAKIFSKASPIEQYNYLHEALQNVGGRVSASGLKVIQNAINELEPIVSKLLPGASKMELGNILKWGAGKVGRGLWNLVKTTATGAGFYELGAGGKHIKGLLGLDNLTN